MSFLKGVIMIFMWYAYVMLAGTAIYTKNHLSAIIAPIWLGLILMIFPVFKKKTEDINE